MNEAFVINEEDGRRFAAQFQELVECKEEIVAEKESYRIENIRLNHEIIKMRKYLGSASNEENENSYAKMVQIKKNMHGTRTINSETVMEANREKISLNTQRRRYEQGRGRQVEERRKQNREKLIVIGDSMVREVDKVVGMKEVGSFKKTLAGAGIKQIVSAAEDAAVKLVGEGSIFVQGGGNSLWALGPDKTVEAVMKGLDSITNKNRNCKVGFISILPRPRENAKYEDMRLYCNWKLQQEIEKMKSIGNFFFIYKYGNRARY